MSRLNGSQDARCLHLAFSRTATVKVAASRAVTLAAADGCDSLIGAVGPRCLAMQPERRGERQAATRCTIPRGFSMLETMNTDLSACT